MKAKLQLLTFLLFISSFVFAQGGGGGIDGKVLDEKKQPLDGASVKVFQGGLLKGGAKADLSGNYRVKPLDAGKYEVHVTFVGYPKRIITDVLVSNDKVVGVNIQMEKPSGKSIDPNKVVITANKRKLVDVDTRGVITKDQLKVLPTVNIGDQAALAGSVYQQKQGQTGISISGGRTDNTLYMIDGVPIRGGGNVKLPVNGVEQIQVLTNGVSAKYGNASGGIVNIVTNGISRITQGGVQLEHSIDYYNHNILSVNLSGPFLSRYAKDAFGNKYKKPLVGYSFSASGNYDKDSDPFYYKYNVLKPEVLERIQTNPLIGTLNAAGENTYIQASETVTKNDFMQVKARQNGGVTGLTTLGKLIFQPKDNITITLGSTYIYNDVNNWSYFNSIFSPDANNRTKQHIARGFLRLTQKLGKEQSKKEGEKVSPISGAYYSIQFSYQKELSKGQNGIHKDNLFNYGYLGKFDIYSRPRYEISTILANGKKYTGLTYGDPSTDSIIFTPGGLNPLKENYTKLLFNDSRNNIRTINEIAGLNALRNGDSPDNTYDGLFSGVGDQVNGYNKSDRDIIDLNLDASFDVTQKSANKENPLTHSIEFGLSYNQTVRRGYSVGPNGLWDLMRTHTNFHVGQLDRKNPIFMIDGKEYTASELENNSNIQFSQFDTIRYNPLFVGSDQFRFDKELRKQLFNNENDTRNINIDALDPKSLSISMFSADELLRNGSNPLINYFGYDYLGNKYTKQPSFQDFWTKKDARGDFARPISAFKPIYMAGYILDKFKYKDLFFNVGVRIDRYDANQKVLKDPYSLYARRTVGDLKGGDYILAKDIDGNIAPDPLSSGFDKEYVPYVDNIKSSTPTIIGYRKGDTWFDPFGKEIANPEILSGKYANGFKIAPYLFDKKIDKTNSITSENFKVNNSFKDFKPDIAISPRIQFTFPISTDAQFYGNYDVMTQTPYSGNVATPFDYYTLGAGTSRQDDNGINQDNANLRMEKSINYSLGYQQKLTKRSAITIEALYKERRNQIQSQSFLEAYPVAYVSYGNRDFSSTKGFTFKYELRKTGPIRMTVDYTLQFTEGTGSSTTSAKTLFSSGLPNLRVVTPLTNDSRHMLNFNIDYRYGDQIVRVGGKEEDQRGPRIGNSYPFKNMGVNFLMKMRSGEPYTRSKLATPIVGGGNSGLPISGTPFGARLPWNYEASVRVDKNVKVYTLGKRKEVKDNEGKVTRESKEGRKVYANIYCYVQNLFNTRNALGLYNYTGKSDDDGYLTSPQGQQKINNLIANQQSYRDLYTIRMINPSQFNNPRRINIGISLDF
jgi:hypothetical protein